jgi:hypothetical protein
MPHLNEPVEHALIINSPYARHAAECACGKWQFSFTGKRTMLEIKEQHNQHLRNHERN